MSFGICRVDKVKSASAIAGIQIHDRRERSHSNSNPDIDFSISNQNYSFVDVDLEKYDSFNDYINQQIKKRYTGSKAIRKDAVKMIDVIFTSDSDFFADKSPEQIRSYFQSCLDFAKRKWGAENIVSAIVHLDENTPHLHLNFIPLTKDGRLSAKDMLGGKKELQQLQDDFYTEVAKQFGLERGHRSDLENPEDVPAKHLTVTELKKKTMAQELEQRVETARKAAEQIENISELAHEAESITTVFGKPTGNIRMPQEAFMKIKNAAKGYDEDRQEIKRLQEMADGLNDEIAKLKKENEQAAEKNAKLQQEVKSIYPLKEELRVTKNELSSLQQKFKRVMEFIEGLKLAERLREFLKIGAKAIK